MTSPDQTPNEEDREVDDVWHVYVLASESRPITYVGITKDLPRRTEQHNGALPGGARATRSGRPWNVARTYGPFATRGEAQRVEYQVKQLRGHDRLRFERAEEEDIRE